MIEKFENKLGQCDGYIKGIGKTYGWTSTPLEVQETPKAPRGFLVPAECQGGKECAAYQMDFYRSI